MESKLIIDKIGGGWEPDPTENTSLSHVPLVWMVREAQKAGLVFNIDKLRALGCHYEEDVAEAKKCGESEQFQGHATPGTAIPIIEVNDNVVPSSHSSASSPSADLGMYGSEKPENWKFVETLNAACTRGKIHDPLQRGQGTPTMGVLSWNIMEFLPFRRMDLRPDGSWKAISWPLPMGETRDVPLDVKIHNSVIRRMKADKNYRPGNLIVGGGGRGTRHAPSEHGIGEWEAVERGKGHPVDELFVRARQDKTVKEETKEQGDMEMI